MVEQESIEGVVVFYEKRGHDDFEYVLRTDDGKTYEILSNKMIPKDLKVKIKLRNNRVMDWVPVMENLEFIYPSMKVLEEDINLMVAHIHSIKNGLIVIKHHNDADGIASALIFYRMFKALGKKPIFIQQNSAVYTPEDALRDLMFYEGYHFIFLDFGNNPESQRGIDILKKGAKSLAIVDHHISSRKKANEIVVTPIWRGLGGEYTAGLLAYEIARRTIKADYDEIYKVSLYGDKSSLLFDYNDKIMKTALVFDYIATLNNRKGMAFINEIYDDSEMINSIYMVAKDKIDEYVEVALKMVKKKVVNGDWKVYLLNLENVMNVQAEIFPPKGKVTGAVHDYIVKQTPNSKIITIGYTSNALMFRATKNVQDVGFNASEIIQSIKRQYGDLILSGGGHPGAAAMRYRSGFKNILLDAILKEMIL